MLSVTEPFREKIHINPGVKKLLEEGGSREKWMRAREEGGEASVLETRVDGKTRHGIRNCSLTLHFNTCGVSVGLCAYSQWACDDHT